MAELAEETDNPKSGLAERLPSLWTVERLVAKEKNKKKINK